MGVVVVGGGNLRLKDILKYAVWKSFLSLESVISERRKIGGNIVEEGGGDSDTKEHFTPLLWGYRKG